MDILALIDEATKEADSFENHPAKELTLEERLLYLQGLALVMNVDGEIHEEEKEYIRILIKSFEMDESALDSFVAFAQAPDKDTVQLFFKTYRRRPIAQLFLFDALMMTRRDGQVDDKENAIIDSIADKLEILRGIQEDIFDLFCYIKNRNWRESALYFNSHLLNPDHFKHLLAYHELNYDQLMEETNSLRATRILQAINNKMPELTPGKKVKPELTHGIIIPMLQADLDRGSASVNGGIFSVDDNFGTLELDLETYGLGYDKEKNSIFKASDAEFGQANKYIAERLINMIGASTAAEIIEVLYDSKIDIPIAYLEEDDSRHIRMKDKHVDESFPYFKLNGRILEVAPSKNGHFLKRMILGNYYLSNTYSSQINEFKVQYSKNDPDERGFIREPDIDSLLKRIFFKGLDIIES